VRTCATAEEFIQSTGQPGWMAASSDGQAIALQPLDLLARQRIFSQTLRHELTHLVVHRLRAPGVPRWFEEGLVLYTTGERIEGNAGSFKTKQELERAISSPKSPAEMKAAYAEALAQVRELARSQGEAGLWHDLTNPGAEVFNGVRTGQ
jgi:hypothetical protein